MAKRELPPGMLTVAVLIKLLKTMDPDAYVTVARGSETRALAADDVREGEIEPDDELLDDQGDVLPTGPYVEIMTWS